MEDGDIISKDFFGMKSYVVVETRGGSVGKINFMVGKSLEGAVQAVGGAEHIGSQVPEITD